MKLCACITGRTPEECLKAARTLDTELIEHRMDFMEELKGLEELYKSSKAPFIATNRPEACGGHFKGTEEERTDLLIRAIDAGCSVVDIEIETSEELKRKVIGHAKARGCKVIISMHDFEQTPGEDELVEVMNKEKEQGADIGKIVTIATSMEDCHRVLGLLIEAKRIGFPLVAFAMGDRGRITRIVAPFYGAPFMYASTGERAGGPSQLSVEAMRKIDKELIS
jgi:3-dehydroquinate dehydratase-1